MLERSDQRYEHRPETVSENNTHKLLWDKTTQCDHTIETRRPDIVIIDKVEKSGIIVDVVIPGDKRVYDKEKEKIGKYQDTKREIQRFWSLREVSVVPVIVGSPWKRNTQFQEICGKNRNRVRDAFCTKKHTIRDNQDIEESIRVLSRNRTRNLRLLVIISFHALHIGLPSTSDLNSKFT